LEKPDPNHPLLPALRMARQHQTYIDQHVQDYTCVLVKRERIEGELLPYEHMFVKCRHERVEDGRIMTPFSVYMKFLAPQRIQGREVLYVKGRDRGDVLVKKGGRRANYVNLWIDPHGELALRENRYPITEFGIANMVKRLIQVAEEDVNFGECEVRFYKGAKLDGRLCTGIEVVHPVRRDHFLFHVARILVDDQLHVPAHFAAYDWPETPGGQPVLMEEYTFRNIRLNVGLTDLDFDRMNAEYGFRKE
jgi:hypothetical protein